MTSLSKQTQLRYVTIPISVTNPTTAGSIVEASVQLDRAFNRIVGIAFHEIADGGIANNYQVGAKSNRQTWVDPVNINNWNANTGVAIEGKFREVNIPYGAGDTFSVQVIPGATTSAAMSGEMVLILAADDIQMPS